MSTTIGARLRQARELRQLSIEQVSEITKIRPRYLQALENDDLSAIPSAAQARGFLRLYARFLELDADNLLSAAQPPVPAPPLVAAEVSEVEPPAASRSAGLWAALRDRLPSRRKDVAVEPDPISAVSVEPVTPASADPQASTTPRPRPATPDLKKKNRLS